MTQPPGYPTQPSDPYGQPQDPYGRQPQDPFTPPQQYYVPQGQPVSGMPYPPQGQPAPGMGYPQPPTYAPEPFAADPYGQYPYGQPPPLFPPSPKRGGRGLVIGLVVLACLLVLGGGSTAAYLVFGRSEGNGAPTPSKAVDQFLTAVFKDKNAESADAITCASARDSAKMRKRLAQLREFELKYKSPTYTWPDPTVESERSERATVTATVKLATSDDRVSEQRLKFTTVKGDGWLVCEITPA